MLSEIGSNFWISPDQIKDSFSDIDISLFGIEASDVAWLSSCRSAISLAIENIERRKSSFKKIAILPSYTCETVVEPFLKRDYEIIYYSLDAKLEVDNTHILNICKKCADGIILFHRYFGFDTLSDIDGVISEVKKRNISVIEDRTQCLYSEIQTIDADFWVGSIRKWCGVVDGGFVACNEGVIDNKPHNHDKLLEKKKLEASLMKYRYLFENTGIKSEYLNLYREAENILDSQDEAYKISPVSIAIQNLLDIDNMKEVRKSNYWYVKNYCRAESLFEDFDEAATPLYYPIIVEKRESLQAHLRDNNIYAPIIWPKADCIDNVCCDQLYEKMLCLPVDQRYDRYDMERMVDIVNNFIKLQNKGYK